jgi:hypothetical protein
MVGLMVVPAVLGVGYYRAVASPVEGRPSARVMHMLEGDFRAHMGRTDSLLRKVCRIDAPALGERVLYVEERFEHGSGRPYAQRLLVVSDAGTNDVRLREYTFADPGSMLGACSRAERPVVGVSDVIERRGCDVRLSLRSGRFTGRIEGRRCESVLNGASHAKRAMEVTEREVSVHDRGYTDEGTVAWGAPDAIRFVRR